MRLALSHAALAVSTGDKGMEDARATSEAVSGLARKTFNAPSVGPTAVMSTGVIGQHLPMEKIKAGINALVPALSDTHESWLDAATAIMTTDTFPKLRSREIKLPSGTTVRFAGMCKGAGMIQPNMATMLSTVYTDAAIAKPLLDEAVRYAADWSFNAITVDGDMSTNDTFMVLANGGAGGKLIADKSSEDYKVFRQHLKEFSEDLAQLVVRDGEGATKFVTVHVDGARSFAEAKKVATSVANSSLVKTALYGQDANWGRIICAVGYSGVPLDPTKVNLRFSSGDGKTNLHIFKDGAPFDTNEEVASSILKGEDIYVRISLGLGNEEAKMYTCDFSTEYVHINAVSIFHLNKRPGCPGLQSQGENAHNGSRVSKINTNASPSSSLLPFTSFARSLPCTSGLPLVNTRHRPNPTHSFFFIT